MAPKNQNPGAAGTAHGASKATQESKVEDRIAPSRGQQAPTGVPHYANRRHPLLPGEIDDLVAFYNEFVDWWNEIELDRSRPLSLPVFRGASFSNAAGGRGRRVCITFKRSEVAITLWAPGWRPWVVTGVFGPCLRHQLRRDQVRRGMLLLPARASLS